MANAQKRTEKSPKKTKPTGKKGVTEQGGTIGEWMRGVDRELQSLRKDVATLKRRVYGKKVKAGASRGRPFNTFSPITQASLQYIIAMDRGPGVTAKKVIDYLLQRGTVQIDPSRPQAIANGVRQRLYYLEARGLIEKTVRRGWWKPTPEGIKVAEVGVWE